MVFGERVPEALSHALLGRGYADLTAVQRAVLAVEPRTRDMLVSAPTGSGKTLAFGLALASGVLGPDGRAGAGAAPRAVVITPTRELARQVQGELAWLYAGAGARAVCCTGGTDARSEAVLLGAGCEIVVGSPGRLRDQIDRAALDMSRVACVVLDEADDMLDLGFRDDLEFILRAAGTGRQTLMFSATLPPRTAELAARFQSDAIRISAAGADLPQDVRYEAVAVAADDREAAIVNILRYHDAPGAIVFCATRETVSGVAGRLARLGFEVVALSGALSQAERIAAFAAMRDGRARVCVATDLAARGLDLPRLDLVIHADPPACETALIHRSGRTGRAGRKGLAVLLAAPSQRRRVERLIRRAGVTAVWVAVPGFEAVMARDTTRMLAEIEDLAEATEAERAAVALLVARAPEVLALGFLRSYLRMRPAAQQPGRPAERDGRPRQPEVGKKPGS